MNQPPNNPYGAPPQGGGYGQPPGFGQPPGPPGGFGQPPGFAAPGPPGAGAPGGQPPVDAGAKVKIPALLMMILSALTILLNVVNILLNILGVGMGAMNGGEEAMGAVFQGGVGIGVAAISILFNAVVFFGAMKMKNLQGHTFALVSAVLFSLPCSACCLVNMPIGIWALIVLLNKDVKAAFQS